MSPATRTVWQVVVGSLGKSLIATLFDSLMCKGVLISLIRSQGPFLFLSWNGFLFLKKFEMYSVLCSVVIAGVIIVCFAVSGLRPWMFGEVDSC